MSEPIRNKKLDLPTAAPFVSGNLLDREANVDFDTVPLRTLPPTMRQSHRMLSSPASQASKRVCLRLLIAQVAVRSDQID